MLEEIAREKQDVKELELGRQLKQEIISRKRLPEEFARFEKEFARQKDLIQVPIPPDRVSALIPLTLRSPPASDQSISDEYIEKPGIRHHPTSVIDALMPIYLSEELSPRFAKHKVAEAWRQRKDLERSGRKTRGEKAVADWWLGGRDTGLREVMDSDEAGLEGVPLRPRTVEEVREAALAEHDEELEKEKKFVKRQIVAGWTWDASVGKWVRGEKTLRRKRKIEAKKRRAERIEERMKGLKLKPGKNMVLPSEVKVAVDDSLPAIEAPLGR